MIPPKRVFLIQTEMGHPDPWDDSLNMSNTEVNPGLGISSNPTAYESMISFFQRADNRFSISNSLYPETHLVLKRPFSMHDPQTEVMINFDNIADLINKSEHGVVMLGAVLGETMISQQDVIGKSSFYHRKDGEVQDMISGEIVKDPRIIPWLFCYKTKDFPLYYMVLNPHSVQCISNIEGPYNGNHVYTISNHLKNLNEVIFKPALSKNARAIGEHNLIVTGDEFTIEPFGTWFVKKHLPEFFKKAKVKISTNFDYELDGNKIRVKTLNKEKGYISLRWNTGTVMDMSFHTSKNRFLQEFIVDVIR
jgi:hypothetical protein